MKKAIFTLLASLLLSSAALAGDVTAPIRQFLDGFNTNDMKAVNAAYAKGDILIVDEFAPYRWYGPNASELWLADYDKHAKATGVSDETVKYGEPTRTEIAGDTAYVIVPTTYIYKEQGKPLMEEAEMTFILHNEAGNWKITSWIWSGVKPHPPK